MRKLLLLLLVLLAALLACSSARADLVLAENGVCPYQIVIPDKAADEIVDDWLLGTAKLMQAAFEKNGFKVEVVREGAQAADKPGIYLGATKFAEKHGGKVEQFNDWTYCQKAVGKDIVIAGNDRKDPVKTIQGSSTPLALLGTVKGTCDFLRQYVGVRFLFMNMDAGPCRLDGNGSLKLDTRSIAFNPVGKIAVPDNLDLKKTPMLRACADGNYETFYHIANNFFPLLSFVQGSEVHWGDVISRAEYGTTHPEYFALMPDGRRSIEHSVSVTEAGEEKHCVTQAGVLDLMARELAKKVKAGEKTIMIMPPDSYRLCRCNCEGCTGFFGGTKAESWDDIQARGRSGKLWQAYFAIAKRLQEMHPEARLVIWDYQDTPVNTVGEVPANVIPKLNMGSKADFNRLEGVKTPAGICVLEETFTGFGVGGPYLPERTPEYIAGMAQTMARYKVQWSTRDGAMGNVRGLQAAAYYVYGRMLDDPSADWRELLAEFCAAAFGDVAPTMRQFHDSLHEQIALYSDFFGINAPAWGYKYGRSTYHGNKWHVLSMYPPEYCAAADALLSSAEHRTKDADVKARLQLLRIEFNYLRGLSRIFHLHNAWLLNPSQESLKPLVESIDTWHAQVKSAAGKRLDDWPQMTPFSGQNYNHASLRYRSYQQTWDATCVQWDTAAIRAGILESQHRLTVPTVETPPVVDDGAWDRAPEQVLRVRDDMPFCSVRTTLKALRDREALYVRVDCLSPAEHPEDIPQAKTERDVFKQEHVDLAIQPSAGGKIYRLAANPTSGLRYHAAWTVDAGDQLTEDTTWSGRWEFAFKTTGKKSQYGLADRVWTAWFRIPYAALDVAAPAPGATWRFNVDRVRINPGIAPQHILWRNAPSITNPQTLGTLAF